MFKVRFCLAVVDEIAKTLRTDDCHGLRRLFAAELPSVPVVLVASAPPSQVLADDMPA